MKINIIIVLLSLGMISCNNSNKSIEIPDTTTGKAPNDLLDWADVPKIAQQIAEKNGIRNWDKISKIAFTFNVDRDGNHFERSWTWKPQTQDVAMISEKDTIEYNRTQIDSLSIKTDAAFINDKYWLLASFQLVWDRGMEFSIIEKATAPISKDTLGQLTIVYPNEGGYTPGDAYDFFFDSNFKIKEWNYRKENAAKPSLTTTWEGYKNFEGIDIATMHQDSTGDFKLYFTNISVEKELEH